MFLLYVNSASFCSTTFSIYKQGVACTNKSILFFQISYNSLLKANSNSVIYQTHKDRGLLVEDNK